MRVEEAVPNMSKAYLSRVIDSFARDIYPADEKEARKFIIQNAKELSDQEHLRKKLQRDEVTFRQKVLLNLVLQIVLESEDYRLAEKPIIDAVYKREQEIIEQADKGDVFRYRDEAKLETYQTVLEVALQDDVISEDEMNLLTRLRRHLNLREVDHYLLQAKLNKFPRDGNRPHTQRDIKDALNELQKRGVLFYCNRAENGPFYLVPQEVAPGVKKVLGIELNDRAYERMLGHLTKDQLREVLADADLPTSGAKEEQIARVMEAGIQPSEGLDALSSGDLKELCESLPGVNVSGTKQARIDNIIEHFDRLKTVEIGEEADKREKYYKYYAELAHRDRQNLLSNKIVGKDADMDRAFEEATRYLFEERLGLQHEAVSGSENPDGVLRFSDNGALFMWDTKSKESTYKFPNDHLRQFKRYIRDAPERVSCFLIIAPTIDESAIENAIRLKAESGTDTDVALVAAEDLKEAAETWTEHANKHKQFNLDVLNYTGILDWQKLKQRMKIFLK